MGVETPLHSKKKRSKETWKIHSKPGACWGCGGGEGEGLAFFAWHKSGNVLNGRPSVRWVLCLAL